VALIGRKQHETDYTNNETYTGCPIKVTPVVFLPRYP